MDRIVIKRATWLRGEGGNKSYLFRPADNKMCCLGFACEQLGVPQSRLNYSGTPASLIEPPDRFVDSVITDSTESPLFTNNNTTLQMMMVNDDPRLTEMEREQKLTELAKTLDMELVFEDLGRAL